MVRILRDENYKVGPVYYLFNYYSKNHYPDDAISEEDRFIRNGILNFKSGIDSENRNAVINAMVEAVMQIPGINSGTVALFCVPASSQGSSALRYGELLARLRQNCPSTIRWYLPVKSSASICRATAVPAPAPIFILKAGSTSLMWCLLMTL